jgi:O-antigen/teichoic acid export membrane protein
MTLEMPFVQLVIALKQGGRVFRISVWFIAAYSITLLVLVPILHAYAIPVAMFIAQCANTSMYVIFIRRVVARSEWNAQPAVP